MRILMIGPVSGPVTGTTIANRMAYRGWVRLKHDVATVDLGGTVEIVEASRQGLWKIAKVRRAAKGIWDSIVTLTRRRWDVLYATPGLSFPGFMRFAPIFLVARLRRTPVSIHLHGGSLRSYYESFGKVQRLLVGMTLRLVDQVIVLGHELTASLPGLVAPERVVVCANAVQDGDFPAEDQIAEKWRKAGAAPRLLFLSNLIRSKGILDLFDAMRRLTSRGFRGTLDLAGAVEPVVEEALKSFLTEMGGRVTYHGVVEGEAKARLLAAADIFLLPSTNPREGQPIAILEAYAAGCAVVSTTYPGNRDIFADGQNGYACAPADPKSIADAVLRMGDSASQFGQRNRTLFLSSFTEEHFFLRVAAALSKIAAPTDLKK